MRKLVIATLSLSMLAACSSPTPPPAQDDSKAVEVQAAPSAVQVGNADFPEGISPEFKFKIRSRKSEDSADGTLRRIVIEFKEGDIASIDAKMQSLLEAKGYKRYKSLNNGSDLVGDYGKPNRRVTVTTSAVSDKMKLDSDSLGTVYIVWKN